MIPDPSGQLAELIVSITSTRVDLYSHQILLRDWLIIDNFNFILMTFLIFFLPYFRIDLLKID